MDRNRVTKLIAGRVSLAIIEAGTDAQSVARAADITTSELNDRLNGCVEFQLDELVRVGGFLHVPATRFLEVAA